MTGNESIIFCVNLPGDMFENDEIGLAWFSLLLRDLLHPSDTDFDSD